MLARWRERDVFKRVDAPPRGGAPEFVFYEGPPTANGLPGSHHVLARVFKDVFPRYKTMTGPLRRAQGRLGHARPAGRDRRRAEAGLHLEGGHRALRHRRVQRPVPQGGARAPRGLEGAHGADRLLGRPRRGLLHVRPELRRVGLVGAQDDVGPRPALRGPQGRALLRALRHGALLARGRAGLRGRRGPLRVRPLPGRGAGGRAARGRHAAGLDDHALDAGRQRRRRGRPGAHLRAHRRRRGARRGARGARARRGRRDHRPLPGRRDARRALRAAVRVPARLGVGAEGPHGPARRLRQRRATARASSTPRSPSARTTTGSAPSRGSRSSTRSGSTGPTTSASARTPAAGSRTPTTT